MDKKSDHGKRMVALRRQCEDLNRRISDQSKGTVSDFAEIRRLREEQRRIREQIAALERTTPDIIA